MRPSAPLRPLALAAVIASLGWSILTGCSSDNTEYRTLVEPIHVYQILFPDSVPVGQPDSLVALARVGYEGCIPGEVSLVQSGDSLVVSGTFTCRVPKYDVVPTGALADPGGLRMVTPPASAIETRAVLVLPDLVAGTYYVVGEARAGEQLLDTLVVTTQAPVARHERLTGFGYVYQHAVASCTSQPVAYENNAVGWELRRVFLVDDPLVPLSPTSVQINATILGPASCDSSFPGVLHLRNRVPWQ